MVYCNVSNLFTIKNEIEYFYRGIFKYYTEEKKPNWFVFFTDSTYYEIKDWFAYMCGIEFDYELLDNDFVYDYAQYIWTYLLENFTEKPKDEDKMISLNKACEWILENMPKYVDTDACCLKRDVYEHLMVKDFKKAMEE